MSVFGIGGQLVEDIQHGPENAAKLLNPVHPKQSQLGRSAEAILKAAEKYHVNPAALWGIFGVETSYGSGIRPSSTNAKGPFQFEPATAKEYGYPIGPNEYKLSDWGAFQKQAEAAAHFLAAHGGTDPRTLRKAIEAYNPGEGPAYYANVKKHAQSFSHPIAAEGANQAEAAQANAPASGSGGLISEIFAKLGTFTLTAVLILLGGVLVIYGIIVAVRPRDRALAVPTLGSVLGG